MTKGNFIELLDHCILDLLSIRISGHCKGNFDSQRLEKGLASKQPHLVCSDLEPKDPPSR